MAWLRSPRVLLFLSLSAFVTWADDCVRMIVENQEVVGWSIPVPSMGAETAEEAALRFMVHWLDEPPTARLYLWRKPSPEIPSGWVLHAPKFAPQAWESQQDSDIDTAEVVASEKGRGLKLVAVQAKRFGRWATGCFAVTQNWSGNWFVVGEAELLPALRARNEFWEDAWDTWLDPDAGFDADSRPPQEDPPLW